MVIMFDKTPTVEQLMKRYKGTLDNAWCPCCLAKVVLSKLEEIPIDRDGLEKLIFSFIQGTQDCIPVQQMVQKMQKQFLEGDFDAFAMTVYALKFYTESEEWEKNVDEALDRRSKIIIRPENSKLQL